MKRSGSGAALSSDARVENSETFHGKTGNSNLKRIAGTDF
jgi:hypothetical protein